MSERFVWNGTMKLSNVVYHLAEQLNVPTSALELKFKWPSTKSGKIETVENGDAAKCTLTDLRTVWQP